MQKESSPTFIHGHSGVVKGVAFSPKNRYVFCSGGTDGKVNVYNALQGQHTMSTRITSPHAMKNINAVKFNADGSRILSTTSKRLSVIDAEKGELICSYDNCAYNSTKDIRSPLASDPKNPNIAICGCTNGKGLITIDLRKQQPAHFALNVHSSLIRDIIYLDESWPFGDSHQGTVASLSSDGVCKLRTSDDRELHVFDVKHTSNCVAATPDVYSCSDEEGFEGIMMIGGDANLSGYEPINGKIFENDTQRPVHKLKYSSNGHILYAIGGLQVFRYQRWGTKHIYLGEVYSHDSEIVDMDLSPNNEFIITGCRGGRVGLVNLGAPSVGWTGYYELA